MIFLYQIFIFLYQSVLSIAALWNEKARQWRDGRRELFTGLQEHFPGPAPLVWVHAASAGEFEQAKPVIESIKKNFPGHKVLVSFFSPSGYAQGKKWKTADHVCYLPMDTRKNAERFVLMLQPRLVVFIKYDFWYHHLKTVQERGIPLLLVAALFRENQVFFKWYGTLHRSMLHFFTHLFVQDEASVALLKKNGVTHCSATGDTRFDRVAAIAGHAQPVPFIDTFKGQHQLLVAGSTWPEDEKMLLQATVLLPELKLLLAPHEVNSGHIKQIEQLFGKTLLYSTVLENSGKNIDVQEQLAASRVLVIDNVGMLSRLYHHASITYIGGGFNKSGIHNTLEAAVYGRPVIFGPNYMKFREARELMETGAAFSYTDAVELTTLLQDFTQHKQQAEQAGKKAAGYVQQNKGATEKILRFIQEKRLLTS